MDLTLVPEPWGRELVLSVHTNDFVVGKRQIEMSKGGQVWSAMEELRDGHEIVRMCIGELFGAIDLFFSHSESPSFWSKTNTSARDAHTLNVKKTLFAAASSAYALKDSARNFQRKYALNDYDQKRLSLFKDDGLNEFVFDLRNYGVHVKLVEANWQINQTFGPNHLKTEVFVLDRDELLVWSKWSASARSYLQGCDEKVDVRKVFSHYLRRVDDFYAWHWAASLEANSLNIQRYHLYRRWCEETMKKSVLGFYLNRHEGKDSDPFISLPNYLTTDQLGIVLSYPYKSVEQVQKIIQLLDFDSVVDDAALQKCMTVLKTEVPQQPDEAERPVKT